MNTFKLILFIFTAFLLFISCSKKTNELSYGNWRGVIIIKTENELNEIPFLFTIEKKSEPNKLIAKIYNAEEVIETEEITFNKDSLNIKMPVFKDEIKAKIFSKDSIAGEYIHYGTRMNYSLPFYAEFGNTNRFAITEPPAINVTGKWEVTFFPGDSNENKSIGEFVQQNNKVTGTILTTGGDYRFLEGVVNGKDFLLSCVDGSHTLLFRAQISDKGTLENGILIGGPNWKETWRAVKNDNAVLPDPEKITEINPDAEVKFSLIDLNGNRVSLKDDKFKNKVVILQIMGSWCPNCMDETRLFSELYNIYNQQGLEIIGLCFETKDTTESIKRIKRFSEQLQAKYTFLYAGEVGKKSVLAVLPFMKDLKGYPTTLYLDRNHKIRKIYTGFSGPGTGKHYDKLRNDIIQFIEKLINEK
ncbi:MAG: TlpA family protein disulfide reductase [Ignavibacteria bacterium]|nr:TlpA family protein disulfide reductase [Ignavibacteria bacterium]